MPTYSICKLRPWRIWVYSVKLKIMTGNTRGSSLVLNSLEQTNRAAYCLQLASLCDVWWAACHADVTGTHVGADMVMGHMSSVSVLSQTSHMISLRRSPGPVNPSSDDTGGDKSQSLQILSQFTAEWEQWASSSTVYYFSFIKYCFQASKIWELIEKENLSHDVTVLIKGSLE